MAGRTRAPPVGDANPGDATSSTHKRPLSVDTPPPSPPASFRPYGPSSAGDNASTANGRGGHDGTGLGQSSSALPTPGPPPSMPLATGAGGRPGSTPSTPTSSNHGPSADIDGIDGSCHQRSAASKARPRQLDAEEGDEQKQNSSNHGATSAAPSIGSSHQQSPRTPLASMSRHSPRSGGSAFGGGGNGGGGTGPHTPRTAANRKRRTVQSTAKSTAGVENSVRRLVEYFVVVSSVRRKRPGHGSGRATRSGSADVGGAVIEQQGNGEEVGSCPPSPPPVVQGMMTTTGSPSHSPSLGRKVSWYTNAFLFYSVQKFTIRSGFR